MPEIVIFGGTTEGRREAEQLFTQGNAVTVSVTSAYARSLLPPQVKCHVGVLNRQEMLAWLSKARPRLPWPGALFAGISSAFQLRNVP